MKRCSAFLLLVALLSSGACNPIADSCGPFKDKFRTAGFYTEVYKVAPTERESWMLHPLDGDTLAAGELALRLVPNQVLYFTAAAPRIGFIASAYACSPPIPTSDEVLRDLQIYSDQALDETVGAGENLANAFEVVRVSQSGSVREERQPLPALVAGQPHMFDELVLVLKSAPPQPSTMQFTVKLFLEGQETVAYEASTEAVVLGRE